MNVEYFGERERSEGIGSPLNVHEVRVGDARVIRNFHLPEETMQELREAFHSMLAERGLRPSDVRYRTAVGQVTDSPRVLGSIDVLKRDDEGVLESYLVKRSHGGLEAEVAGKMRGYSCAPETLYSDDAVIVEEFVPQTVRTHGLEVGTSIRDRGGFLSTALGEPEMLGERLAKAVYDEMEAGLVWTVGYMPEEGSRGRIVDTHVKLLDVGRDIRPVFLDWGEAINIRELSDRGEMDRANRMIKEHIMMLMGVVRRRLNDGPDAIAWNAFEKSLVQELPTRPSESLFWHTLIDEVHSEAENHETWGDRQAAEDWRLFFSQVHQASVNAPLDEKPVEYRTSMVRDLSMRKIPMDQGEAIADYLAKEVQTPEEYKRINFTMIEDGGDLDKGQGILVARGPEPEIREIARVRVRETGEPEADTLAYRASEAGIGAPVLYFRKGAVAEVVAEPNMRDKVGEIQSWDDGEKALRSVGQQMGVMLARMVSRNMMMDKERYDLADSLVITGVNSDDVKVTLTDWRDRVNLDKMDEPGSDRLIMEFMGMALNVSQNAREYGAYIWHEFENTLPQRARKTERRERYERLLKEFKSQSITYDPELEHFFQEAESVTAHVEWEMPAEVEDKLRECGIRDIPRAWGRLQHMSRWGVEQADAAGVTDSNLKGKVAERREEFVSVAIGLLETIKDSGVDPDNAIKELRTIGTTYDDASGHVSRKKLMEEPKVKVMVGDKIDIYRKLVGKPDAVRALTDPDVGRVADILSYRSAYLAKALIELLSERPGVRQEAVDFSRRPTTMTAMRKELKDYLSEVDGWREEEGLDLSDPQQLERFHRRKLGAVKHFTYLGLIRLGYLYTEHMEGRLTREGVEDIYEEMSKLSLVTLEGLYDVEREKLEALYGKPSSKFSIVLGGASSRREFPSYDYDAMGVMSSHGQTSGGSKGSVENQEFFKKVFENLGVSAELVGHHLDDQFVLEETVCATPEEYERILSRKMGESPAALLGLENLTVGCGDTRLGRRMVGFGWRLSMEHASTTASAQLLKRRDRDHWWINRDPNIKYSKGGLRDLMDVMIVHKLMDRLEPNNVFQILEQIDMTREQRSQLVDSYLWLMNNRVRLDLEYGRNSKYLPENSDLRRFAKLLGYGEGGGRSSVDRFMEDFQRHSGRVREITNDLLTKALETRPELAERLDLVKDQLMKKGEADLKEKRREALKESREKVEKVRREMRRPSHMADLWARRVAKERGEHLADEDE